MHLVTEQPALATRVAYSGAQFSALPGALTGREVLLMYARLRGVPARSTEAAVEELLHRIDLAEYADRWEAALACMLQAPAAVVLWLNHPAYVLSEAYWTGVLITGLV